MSGMIGAMLITVVLVVGFVVVRAVLRDDLEFERDPIDHLPVVAAVQEAGAVDPAYPPTLPAGWSALDAGVRNNGWEMEVETADGARISIRQQERVLRDMLMQYVDEDYLDEGYVEVGGPLGDQWQAFSDDERDHAVALMLTDREVLLVFGTAEPDVLRVFASSLVQEPVGVPAPQ